jgi:hypothetical protein
MKKLLAISAALMLTAGGTLWAAVSLPSAPVPETTSKEIAANTSTTPSGIAETMRRRGHGGGDHVCGTRFCGHHCHHHGHVWCDGHSHWYCPGHD